MHNGHLLALRQNSKGADRLTLRNPHVQPANHCSETSKRRKEFNNSPANSCQCFCVMDAPEIYQPSGLVVVSELLTAIQASDVGPSAIDRSASLKVGWDRLAYRRTLMQMGTDKNKTKQSPQKERGPEDHTPPRLRREERSFRHKRTSRWRAIHNYRPLDSIYSGHFFFSVEVVM